MPYDPALRARLLAHPAPVQTLNDGGRLRLRFPAIDPEEMKCGWLYTVALEK